MDTNKHSNPSRGRPALIRGADGRLRSVQDAPETIGDIWAQQGRIRLAEAIEGDKRSSVAAGKKRRKLLNHWKDFKDNFAPAHPREREAPSRRTTARESQKTVEIKISLPHNVRLPSFRVPPRIKALPRRAARGLRPLSRILTKKVTWVLIAVVLIAGIGSYQFLLKPQSSSRGGSNMGRMGTLGAHDAGPGYNTILPDGKSIEDLGGWGRVSPPDRDPVYAFGDKIGQTHITVSEQPIPPTFESDIQSNVKKLAEQYGANASIKADDTDVFIGTSIRGPQSVIFTKGKLLILIKSTAKLTNQQWADYVTSLR